MERHESEIITILSLVVQCPSTPLQSYRVASLSRIRYDTQYMIYCIWDTHSPLASLVRLVKVSSSQSTDCTLLLLSGGITLGFVYNLKSPD